MRETDGIDPMWEDPEEVVPGGRLLGAVVGVTAVGLRRVAPHLLRWAAGKRPGMRFDWGAYEYRLTADGLTRRRRNGSGWGDNPRSNYNAAVERRQARSDSANTDEEPAKPKASAPPC